MKEQRLKKSSQEEIKEVMRKYYGLLRDCYKAEAGMGTTGKIFGVPKGQMTLFF
jgi:hypothetical protein